MTSADLAAAADRIRVSTHPAATEIADLLADAALELGVREQNWATNEWATSGPSRPHPMALRPAHRTRDETDPNPSDPMTVTERMVPVACQLTGHVHTSTHSPQVPRRSPDNVTATLTAPAGQFIAWPT